MKIRTIVITAILVVGAGAATSYFVRRSREANVKKVEVVPVVTVNSAEYSMGDSGTVSGTIISRDTQVVPLDTSHELVDVYVQTGDRVKKGDKLLEYDMLGDELKEEMEELTKLGLELSLESMKKDLETMRSGRMPESLSDGYESDDDADDSSDSRDDEDDEDSGTRASRPSSQGSAAPRSQSVGRGAVGAADTLAAAPSGTAPLSALMGSASPDSKHITRDDLIRGADQLQAIFSGDASSGSSRTDGAGSGDASADDRAQKDGPQEEKHRESMNRNPSDQNAAGQNTPDQTTAGQNPSDQNTANTASDGVFSELFSGDGPEETETEPKDMPGEERESVADGEPAGGPDGKLPGEGGDEIVADLGSDDEALPEDGALISSPDGEQAPSVMDAIPAEEEDLFREMEQEEEGASGIQDGILNEGASGIQDGIFNEDASSVPEDKPALIGETAPLMAAIEDEIVEDNEAVPGVEQTNPETAEGGQPVGDDPSGIFQTEAPPSEAPLTETPQTGAPQTETPQTETPQTGAPQTETPPTETPQTSVPQTDAPPVQDPSAGIPAESEAAGDGIPAQEDVWEEEYVEEPGAPYVSEGENEEELETNFLGEVYVDDGTEEVTDIISMVNTFLSEVNAVSLAVEGGWDAIPSQINAINAGLETFRKSFGESHEYDKNDLFGETVTVTNYTVSQEVRSRVGDATASVLQAAYDRLCVYHFIYTMMSLNADKSNSSGLDLEWAKANEAALRAAVNEYASLPESVWVYNPATGAREFSSQFAILNDGFFSGESLGTFLSNQVQSLNTEHVMEDPPDVPATVSTEGEMWDNYDDDYDDYDGPEYTAEELAEAIRDQEKNIKETELQIREAELGIQEYKKVLDGKIVYATMDGIVKNAGTKDHATGNSFITITGKEGLYVKGTINELSLGTVKVGDTITGTSYETGSSFTAEIVEISDYPETSTNSYYGYGDENTNSSYYPFLAYIQDAEGLEVDSYVDLSLSGSSSAASADSLSSGGLSLDEYYIRKDGDGRSYCYVRGKDGLLERRYLELGANNWGVINIKSGLRQDDYIAFPYGEGVEEGAQTVEVDFLSAVDGGMY